MKIRNNRVKVPVTLPAEADGERVSAGTGGRRPVRRHRAAGAVLAVISLIAAACGTSSSAKPSKPESTSSGVSYVIGGFWPLTGPDAIYGSIFGKIANLAIDSVNSQHIFKGSFRGVFLNDQAEPGPAVTDMQQLTAVDHAVAVLASFSGPTSAAAPIANRTHTLLFNGAASSPYLGKLGPYMFNDIPLGSSQMPAAVQYGVKTLGLKRWAVLYSAEPLGEGDFSAIKAALQKDGGVLATAVEVSPSLTTYEAQISEIAASHPQLVFLADTSAGTFPTFLNEERAAGLTAVTMSYEATDTPPLISDPNANGMLFTTQDLNLTSKDTQTSRFMSEFAKAYGSSTTPLAIQVNVYNAVLCVAEAIHDLQASGKKVDGPDLRSALLDHTFTVAGTTLQFNSNGTLKSPVIVIRKLVNGKEITVATIRGS